MRTGKKYLFLLVLSGLLFGKLYAAVVQGTLADGSPYFYSVSDPVPASIPSSAEEKQQNEGKTESKTSEQREVGRQEEAYRKGEEIKKAEQAKQKEYQEYLNQVLNYMKQQAENKIAMEKALEEERIAEEKRQAAKAEGERAEAELNKAVKKYNELKVQCNSKRNEIKQIQNVSQIDAEYLKKEYEYQEYLVQNQYKSVQDSSDKMISAYKELGKVYEEYGYAGDPVRISTGDYVSEYTDFEAQDYLKRFSVYRNYQFGVEGESFGDGWSCSLDSRIVRFNYQNYEKSYSLVLEQINLLNFQSKVFDDYLLNQYEKYPRPEIYEYLEECKKSLDEALELKQLFEEYAQKRGFILDKNHFVAYGRYANTEKYCGSGKMLVYLDEFGNEYFFCQDEYGNWRAAGKLSSKKMNLTEKRDGSYTITFSDGSSKSFSENGVLVKEVDANGNTTEYLSEAGKIVQIRLKTKEILRVNRNSSGRIISIKGDVSGESCYEYSGSRLLSVRDNHGIKVRYDYDRNGLLQRINKADGSSVEIVYAYDFYKEKYVCEAVIQNGTSIERFAWNFKKKELVHMLETGQKEVYVFNEDGNPVYVKDYAGNEIEFQNNSDGLISAVKENGSKREFFYDDDLKLRQVIYQNGGKSLICYDSKGRIESLSDADGNVNSYEYDNKNNLIRVFYNNYCIAEYAYYSNGLVREKKENQKTTKFIYNGFGSIVQETETVSEEKELTRFYEYDSCNRLRIKVDEGGCVTEFKYGNNSVIETCNGRKRTERYYNQRNKEIRTVVSDLQTGQSYEKNIIYDLSGNGVQVLLNNELYEEKSYSPNNQLLFHTIWNLAGNDSSVKKQGVCIEYRYGPFGLVEEEKRTVVDYSQKYSGPGDENKKDCFTKGTIVASQKTISSDYANYQVREKNLYGEECDLLYDKAGNLLKIQKKDGSFEKRSYSKAGRLMEIRDSKNNSLVYSYNRDGSYTVVFRDEKGNKSYSDYDKNGQLQLYENPLGLRFTYSYDVMNRLGRISSKIFEKVYEYDIYGRLIALTYTDNLSSMAYVEKYVFDDNKNTVQIFKNDRLQKTIRFDVWNRPVEIIDGAGKHFYEYDALNQIVREFRSEKIAKRFEYDALGNVAYICNEDGSEENFVHNLWGQISECRKNNLKYYACNVNLENHQIVVEDKIGHKKEYAFDDGGYLISENLFGTGRNDYKWNNNHLYSTVKNSRGTINYYEFDNQQKIIREENALQQSADYEYDVLGRLIAKKDFDGQKIVYIYDDINNEMTINYSSGEKALIQKNGSDNIIRMKNESSDYSYSYDDFGNLVSIVDNLSSVEIKYEYDDYGRCVEKKSDQFDFQYSYDEIGNCVKILDRISGSVVILDYDLQNRETERVYSNGNKTKTAYNSADMIESRVTFDASNRIISLDLVLYDSFNRVSVICNKEGNWKKFSYDESGKLQFCVYPFSEEVEDFYWQEALDCGVNVKDKVSCGVETFLTSDELQDLKGILRRAEAEENVSINASMMAWKEQYSYDECGNVMSKGNMYGTIMFEHDACNRVVAKYGSNSKSSGLRFKWNENGCLERIEGRYCRMDFEYGAQKRPLRIVSVDYETGETDFLDYSYDVLGRRISECINGEENYAYVYDGFSLEVLQHIPLMGNMKSMVSTVSISGVANNAELKSDRKKTSYDVKAVEEQYSGNDIRWVNDDGYAANGDYRYFDAEEFHENSNGVRAVLEEERKIERKNVEKRPYSVMSFNGLPMVNLYIDNTCASGIESEYLMCDYRGEVVTVCDGTSGVLANNLYDAWGNVLAGEKGLSYSHSFSMLSTMVDMYNLGFRDYCPQIMAFTSMDPARDGSNWYAYCAGDSMNQFDINGLTIEKTGKYDLMTNYDDSVLLGNSKKEKVNKAGCYVTIFADFIQTLKNLKSEVYKECYDSVMKINKTKSLFVKNEEDGSFISRNATMNELFGADNWDYYTAKVSGTEVLKAQLAKLENSQESYLVCCVFDLSEVNEKVTNHMVALNENFNDEGYLTDKTAITGSSENDYVRINEGHLSSYNLNNVKELRFVKTGQDACNK